MEVGASIFFTDYSMEPTRAKLRSEPVREPLPPPKVYAPPRASGHRRRG